MFNTLYISVHKLIFKQNPSAIVVNYRFKLYYSMTQLKIIWITKITKFLKFYSGLQNFVKDFIKF